MLLKKLRLFIYTCFFIKTSNFIFSDVIPSNLKSSEEENVLLNLIDNSTIKLDNNIEDKKNIKKRKVGKCSCDYGEKNKEDKSKDLPEVTENIVRQNSNILGIIINPEIKNYLLKEKKDIFHEKTYADELSKNEKDFLNLDISKFINEAKINGKIKDNSIKIPSADQNIDFCKKNFYLKYVSEIINVSLKEICKIFIEKIKELPENKDKKEEDILISYIDFENVKKSFKNEREIDFIEKIFSNILDSLSPDNPIRKIFCNSNIEEKGHFTQKLINLLSELNILNDLNDHKNIGINGVIITLLKEILKNADERFSLLKQIDSKKFDEVVGKLIENVEFNVEIKLNNYKKFINSTDTDEGFSIEDYVLIFKFIDFVKGNFDIYNQSKRKYAWGKNSEFLKNLAGKEIIDNLVKDEIIDDEYKIKEGQENNFKKNMKLKFTDLQYILNLIENIDIYMYFDKTDEDDINKRYNKQQIIYDMYKKSDSIDNFIKYFSEKIKEEAEKGNNFIIDNIKWKIVALYTGLKEISKMNFANIFEMCTKISKLNIIMNKNYLGIYYDQNTENINTKDKDTKNKK